MIKIEDSDLLQELIPSSIKDEQIFKDSVQALKTKDDTKGHLNDGLFYYRLDELSSDVLDHLANQWHVRVWRDSWSVELKRSILKGLIKEKRRVGSVSAVKNAIASFGSAAVLTEWWQKSPQDKPHTFEIIINQNEVAGTVTSEITEDLIRTLDYTKPVRSQYQLKITFSQKAQMTMVALSRPIVYARIHLNKSVSYTGETSMSASAVLRPFSYAHI